MRVFQRNTLAVRARLSIVGHMPRNSCALLLATVMLPSAAAAQRPELRYDWDSPEGRIMGYYSAGLAFTPVAAPRRPDGIEIGLELAYLPPLDEARRSGGFSKQESTNLIPVLPRPRVTVALPADFALEASYVPPVKVFGVKASLLSAAISRPVWTRPAYTLTARFAASSGLTKGAITCNDDILEEGGGNVAFFQYVCHNRESEDAFHSPALALELLGAGASGKRLVPWAGLGVRHEQNRFVIGVKDFDGNVEPNHPVLLMNITRPYGMLGATWNASRMADVSGELLYAPGSLLTGRFMARTSVGRLTGRGTR